VQVLLKKLREVVFTILPVMLLVLFFHIAVSPLEGELPVRFLIGSVVCIVGLTLFLLGVDVAIAPVGQLVGEHVAKSNRLWIVVAAGTFLGFVICVAEPDLLVLADQIETATGGAIQAWSVILSVSVGFGILVTFGFVRILFRIPLFIALAVIYGIIGILCLSLPAEMIAIAFDAAGSATGALTVPFILALGAGVAALHKSGKSAEKDAFGLVALSASGAVAGIVFLAVFTGDFTILGPGTEAGPVHGILAPFLSQFMTMAWQGALMLSPIVLVFVFGNRIHFHLRRRATANILKGFVFAWLGFVLFLTGVNAGFMDAGRRIGELLAVESPLFTGVFAFLLGFFTVLAEPAVSVLTHQIEDVTAGSIGRRLVSTTLSIGVGFALLLNVVRILTPGFQLWHILLPGYAVALGLMAFCPRLFIAIGFDAGSVASGPICATFIFAFSQGIAFGGTAGNIGDLFGLVALVALTPIVAIEILGILYRLKSNRKELKPHE